MPRPPSPWYDKEKDAWKVTLNGRRITLAKGKKSQLEALLRFKELTETPEQAPAPIVIRSGQQVCKLFLSWSCANQKPNTYEGYKRFLEPFGKTVRTINANDVLQRNVTTFVSGRGWGKTTIFNAITAIKRAWSWAKEQGEIQTNQITGMKRPRPQRREEIMDDREVVIFLRNASRDFREFLEFIHATGCRPGEAAMIERRHVYRQYHEVRFKIGEDKTSGKTDKQRVIHLNERADKILADKLTKGTDGPLFRNSKGNPWTRHAMACACARIRLRTGLDGRAVVYALRHQWATDALARGVPLATVAEMMGNSPEIVARVYSHLSDKKSLLMEAANRVRPAQSDA